MMALNYDFDMLSMTVGAAGDDAGTDAAPPGKPVALFRDAATVEALERAPQAVQDYLRASHFGINCYHSGAPAGRYPEADEAARIAVIEALAENVRRFALPRADDSQPAEGEFHLPSFFAAVAEAEPVVTEPPAVAGHCVVEPAAVATMAMDTVAEAHPEPVATDMTALAVAEMIALETAAEPEASQPEVASEIAGATDTPVSSLILTREMRVDLPADAPAATDSLIAGMLADAEVGTEADTGPAFDTVPEADTGPSGDTGHADDLPPAHIAARRGFRLPVPPRWMTAGAAFVVLGVAVGSAVI